MHKDYTGSLYRDNSLELIEIYRKYIIDLVSLVLHVKPNEDKNYQLMRVDSHALLQRTFQLL
jgi:hypothetical protein